MKANEAPEQYIPKSALVAEVKRRRESNAKERYFGRLVEDNYFLDFLDTLEVKEIQEVPCDHCQGFNDKEKCDELVFGRNCPIINKPVNEDLEEAAKNHAAERYRTTRDRELAEKCKWSFISGAEWYKKHNNKK